MLVALQEIDCLYRVQSTERLKGTFEAGRGRTDYSIGDLRTTDYAVRKSKYGRCGLTPESKILK